MGRHAAALKKDRFVSHSHGQTVKNIIEAGDLSFLKTVTAEEFERLLIDEVEFLTPYDPPRMEEVKRYIRTHRDDLYSYMKQLAEKA